MNPQCQTWKNQWIRKTYEFYRGHPKMMNCYSTQSATNRNTEPRFIAAILDWWRFITSGFFGFTSLALAFGSILTLVAASLSTVSLPGNPAYMLCVVSVKSHGGFTCSVFFLVCVCFPPPLPTRKMGERGRERERLYIYIQEFWDMMTFTYLAHTALARGWHHRSVNPWAPIISWHVDEIRGIFFGQWI